MDQNPIGDLGGKDTDNIEDDLEDWKMRAWNL